MQSSLDELFINRKKTYFDEYIQNKCNWNNFYYKLFQVMVITLVIYIMANLMNTFLQMIKDLS
jgi:hypothetical protein